MTSPTRSPDQILKRNRIWWFFRTRPRLMGSVFLGVVAFFAVSFTGDHRLATRALIAWDIGVAVYLVLGWHMMAHSDHERMRQRARRQDDGQAIVLLLTVIASIACVGAIVNQLAIVKQMSDAARTAHVLLAAVTIVAAWLFVHTMFALHYAHDYYLCPPDAPVAPLDFPGEETPDYFDFLYFAFVIGTSGQTADVSFRSRGLRRIGLLHCTLSFFFNATVLALTINIAASLIQP